MRALDRKDVPVVIEVRVEGIGGGMSTLFIKLPAGAELGPARVRRIRIQARDLARRSAGTRVDGDDCRPSGRLGGRLYGGSLWARVTSLARW